MSSANIKKNNKQCSFIKQPDENKRILGNSLQLWAAKKNRILSLEVEHMLNFETLTNKFKKK